MTKHSTRWPRIGVVTSTEHEAVLRDWLEPASGRAEWIVGSENPDFEKILRSFALQRVEVAIVDDAALVYPEVSEKDLLKHASGRGSKKMRTVFIASTERAKDDAFLRSLAESGLTCILPLRAHSDDPELAKEALRRLVSQAPPSVEEALDAIAKVPGTGRIPLLGRRRQHPRDPLVAEPKEAPEAPVGRPMSEAEFLLSRQGAASDAMEELARVLERESGAKPAPEGPGAEPKRPEREERPPEGGAAGKPRKDRRKPQAGPQAPAPPAPKPIRAKPPEPPVPAARTEPASPKRRKRATFAVAGIEPGAGATHLALSVAMLLASVRPSRRTCCLLSDKAEFDRIRRALARDGETPTIKGVALGYMGASASEWADFDLVVMDCGALPFENGSKTLRLFSTANKRLVVAGGPPWNANRAAGVLSHLEKASYADWFWCLFGATTQFEAMLRRHLESKGVEPKMLRVPYDNRYLEEGSPAPSSLLKLFDWNENGKRRSEQNRKRQTGGNRGNAK